MLIATTTFRCQWSQLTQLSPRKPRTVQLPFLLKILCKNNRKMPTLALQCCMYARKTCLLHRPTRIFPTRLVVDSALQIAVQILLKEDIIIPFHYRPIVGHTGHCRVYDTQRRSFFWTHKSKDVYKTVDRCSSLTSRRNQYYLSRLSKAFSSLRPLVIIVM